MQSTYIESITKLGISIGNSDMPPTLVTNTAAITVIGTDVAYVTLVDILYLSATN